MKKVLIITTHFPPDSHVGGKRAIKFSKYFNQNGWTPYVITNPISQRNKEETSLLKDIKGKVEIFRPNPIRILKIFDYHILNYSYSWIIPAFIVAVKIIKKEKIDLIYSTEPNPDAGLIAYLLKLSLKIKWVCEVRDPLIDYFVRKERGLPFYYFIWMRVVKRILKSPNHIITISKTLKDNIGELDPRLLSNISVVYNGYDEKDFVKYESQHIKKSKKYLDKMLITYLGVWSWFRTPEYFFLALASLFKKMPLLKKNIFIHFYGHIGFNNTPKYFIEKTQELVKEKITSNIIDYNPEMATNVPLSVKSKDLDQVVTLKEYLPQKEALRKLYKSDVLLLVQMPMNARNGCLSSKLFEYLKVKKPILALVPHESEIAKIVEEADAGIIASPTDINEIEKAILKMYELFKNNKLYVNSNKTIIKNFNREKQVAGVVEIFNLVVS